jgi:hypothetical protein
MDDNVTAIIGMVCIFGLPVGGWIAVRILKHRERMAMIERGLVPPDRGRYGRGAWSVPPSGPGAWTAGPMSPPPSRWGPDADPNSPNCLLRKGIVTAMVGFALLIDLSFIGYHGGDGPFDPAYIKPGPWLLGGLIPMFVGVAQIIGAVLGGAQLGGVLRQPPPQPPPPYPGPFPSYGAAPPEPGRPGPRYEELTRPVPPPDRT